jgi:hypothetical protein
MVAAKIDREDGMAQLEARLNELESEAKIEREDFKAHMSARLQERNAEVRQ